MKWFQGSINEAVAASKSRKAIFVVFVEGKDDSSVQVAETINSTEVSSKLEQEHFVAIKLESGSESYRFFAQIYHLVPVPSLFFIGENGVPLEIVASHTITATELAIKIETVLAKGGKAGGQSTSALLLEKEIESAKSSGGSDAMEEIKNIEISKTEDSSDYVKANLESNEKTTGIPTVFPTSSQSSSNTNAEALTDRKIELTPEEKVERAKQLIEIQKKQRLEEEEKKEKERELNRRKMAKDLQKRLQMQHELEIKQAHVERMKEKAEEAAAKKKVRQQIAQDKLERKQRELALQQKAQNQSQEQPQSRAPIVSDATVTRIQFRLPSGNPHMGQFEPLSTLGSLRNYVIENINLPFRHFTMSTSFPRRELTADDDNKTLLDLELVPTAVILILPLKTTSATTAVISTSPDAGFLRRFVWMVFAPFVGFYNSIMGYFYGGSNDPRERQETGTSRASTGARNNDGNVLSHLQNPFQEKYD
ncbi:UBX domain-containing protein 4 isoform X2 [Prorops nasuta]|uniref:UBX domain-containing protein 4 isoform X2 n=1 Tax=Prorops nasuta TaxID=863751 RepID=UPI0034CD3F3D